jgi:sulfite exporter TauE/SafE
MKKRNNLYGYIALALLISVLIIGRLFMFKIDLDDKNFNLGLIIIYSLITNIHCASMCGGLLITRLISMDKYKNVKIEATKYILGRIISYTVMGIILGGFGEVISISHYTRGVISIIAGIIMFLVGLQLFNIIRLPKLKIYPRIKNNSSFLIGLINVLMPCGCLYVVMLYAVTCSSYFYGGLIMFIFSLLTSISFIIISFMTYKIKNYNLLIKYISFIIIIILSIQFILHGLDSLKNNHKHHMLPLIIEKI